MEKIREVEIESSDEYALADQGLTPPMRQKVGVTGARLASLIAVRRLLVGKS